MNRKRRLSPSRSLLNPSGPPKTSEQPTLVDIKCSKHREKREVACFLPVDLHNLEQKNLGQMTKLAISDSPCPQPGPWPVRVGAIIDSAWPALAAWQAQFQLREHPGRWCGFALSDRCHVSTRRLLLEQENITRKPKERLSGHKWPLEGVVMCLSCVAVFVLFFRFLCHAVCR